MNEYWEYFPLVVSGTTITIQISLLSLIIATFLGLFGALAKVSESRILRRIGGFYTIFIRGIPDLVLILLIFYGSQIGLNAITESIGIDYINIEPFTSGFLTIGFIYGAYMTETFRGAIISLDRGQIIAGESFGLNYFQIFTRITFPQMIRHAMAGYINNWLVLIKSTALVSIIGLEDVIRKASIAGSVTKKPFSYLLTAAVIYILITSVSLVLLKILDKKFKIIE